MSGRDKKYATSPATAGAAAEAPLFVVDPATPVPLAHNILSPGALIVIAGPLGEKDDTPPRTLTDPTEMIGIIGEKDAGTLICPRLFPGVQTKMTPYLSRYLRIKYFILVWEYLSIRGELVCMLMTL